MKEIKEFIQELCDCAKPSANGSMAKLVDAPDLSSGVQKWACGFESHSGYTLEFTLNP